MFKTNTQPASWPLTCFFHWIGEPSLQSSWRGLFPLKASTVGVVRVWPKNWSHRKDISSLLKALKLSEQMIPLAAPQTVFGYSETVEKKFMWLPSHAWPQYFFHFHSEEVFVRMGEEKQQYSVHGKEDRLLFVAVLHFV